MMRCPGRSRATPTSRWKSTANSSMTSTPGGLDGQREPRLLPAGLAAQKKPLPDQERDKEEREGWR
jgi:hypothetical protein